MRIIEAATALRVSRQTVWRMCRDGVLVTARRVGNGRGHYEIAEIEVEALRNGERTRRA